MLQPFLQHAVRTGWPMLQLQKLCVQLGVRWPVSEDLEERVPWQTAAELVNAIASRSSENNLGLVLAEKAEPSWMALPGVLGMSAPNVRAALDAGLDCAQRLDGTLSTLRSVSIEQGQVRLCLVSSVGDPHVGRHLIELEFAVIIVLLRRVTGVKVRASRVAFPYPAPASTRKHEDMFGTKSLCFGSPAAELVLPGAVLQLTHASADAGLHAYFRRETEKVARKPHDHAAMSIRQAARSALMRGQVVSLESMASRLGTTGRSLQRALAKDRLKFSAVIEEVRCEYALELLKGSDIGFDEIAERAGYSDARSLRRAMKRYTGKTLQQLRRLSTSDVAPLLQPVAR